MSDISDRNPPDNNHYKKPYLHEESASVERYPDVNGSRRGSTAWPARLPCARDGQWHVVGNHFAWQDRHRYLPVVEAPDHVLLTDSPEDDGAASYVAEDYCEYPRENAFGHYPNRHYLDQEQCSHVTPYPLQDIAYEPFSPFHPLEGGRHYDVCYCGSFEQPCTGFAGQVEEEGTGDCQARAGATVQSASIQYHEPLDVLVEKMSPMIRLTARRLKAQSRIPMHVDMDDLIQAGTVGLIEASQRFNPKQGAAFETYAIKRIQGAMVDELRSSDWLPRSVRRHAREAEQIHTRLEQYYGRPIRERDVAAVMEVSLNTYNRHRNDVHNCQLLDYTDYDLETFLPEEEVEPLNRLLSDELHGLLQLAIASLDDEREREALTLYHLSGNSLRMIGERMGVSDSRVCQLHKRAMEKIRAWFKQYFPELEYCGIPGYGDSASDLSDKPIAYRTYSFRGGPLPPRDD